MKRLLIMAAILSIIMLFPACNKDELPEGKEEVKIYYIDSKTSKLVSEKYYVDVSDKQSLVSELLGALRKEPKHVVYKKAIPDNIIIKEFEFSKDGDLIIDFENSYGTLQDIQEVLCRAAIVKTLTQIDGVEYIEFYVNDQPLIDSNGDYVGLMTKDYFIESTGMQTVYKVPLYFASEDGETLVEALTNISYTGTGSIEEQVINSLINGPTETGMYDTIPEGTILLNVTTKESEGICYVDFNEKFLKKLPNITGEVAVYSIVNSLVELPGINKVQFLVNGAITETYDGNIAFNGPFERNLTLVTGADK